MVRLISLPLIVTSCISILLGIFFWVLERRLKMRHQEAVRHYSIFVIMAFVSGVFLAAFSVLLNSGDNLDRLDVANRITIIAAMFNIPAAAEFSVRFFAYLPPIPLRWCYTANGHRLRFFSGSERR